MYVIDPGSKGFPDALGLPLKTRTGTRAVGAPFIKCIEELEIRMTLYFLYAYNQLSTSAFETIGIIHTLMYDRSSALSGLKFSSI